jgi:hypothetical protein
LPRLSPSDLGVLGRYLYGPRWQTALARELGVSRQLVVYWASGARLVSEERSEKIARIARARHDKRVAAERSAYVAMVEGLNSHAAKSLMLALIANEVQARIQAIGSLTKGIESSLAALAKIAREEVLSADGHALAEEAARQEAAADNTENRAPTRPRRAKAEVSGQKPDVVPELVGSP